MYSPSETQSKLISGVFDRELPCCFLNTADPRSPFSSLSKNTKATLLRLSAGKVKAISSNVATPDVLSLAVCLLAGPAVIHQIQKRRQDV